MIGLLGGTGTAGRALARELAARGQTVVVLARHGERSVIAFTLDAGRIVAIDVVRNPDKLRGVPA